MLLFYQIIDYYCILPDQSSQDEISRSMSAVAVSIGEPQTSQVRDVVLLLVKNLSLQSKDYEVGLRLCRQAVLDMMNADAARNALI